MCQPPRQRIETRTPVLPSGRVGRPAEASAPPAIPAIAPAANVLPRNSRRVLVGVSIGVSLRGGKGSNSFVQRACRVLFSLARQDRAGRPCLSQYGSCSDGRRREVREDVPK